MKVVITGASGNVGTALLRALAPAGWELVGVARRRPDTAREPYSSARWAGVDIGAGTAEDELCAVFTGADAVVHLAWAIHPRTDEPPLPRTNAVGSANVLAAAAAAGVPHLVCASSVAAYTPAGRWRRVGEDFPCAGVPGSAYSMGKAALEAQLDAFGRRHPETRMARIRPCAVVQRAAAAQLAGWLLSPWLPRALLGVRALPVPLWTGLRLQVVHADDVALAIRLILAERAAGAFNLAAESVLPAREVARVVGGVRVPVPLRLLTGPAWVAWRLGLQPLHPAWLRLADQASLVDTTRARAELGWVPRRGAVDALAELVTAMHDDHQHAGAPPLRPPPRRLHLGRPSHQDQSA
ncbi:NAD-dependent epimerase/dehydratase family protein [Actinophytocola algeriensis]|uniref:Nucleoside-diphosphate-sugar epimerase n=1 Tax=Actinophytocola algeriensis TaxID=1768010 RepID=A0A7W7VFP9_9PSEU|nr:NAD-dependent epimerase/dehydratase family protein [Actinophytocola algeriensis]MBB4908592.1 nucleoside-diphosphate-sugar epimerase [Actinophytocola algeriensis]MBE1475021.1 nucleoside-diphosphate-sugar epimerase [Actinophytocola algeriensis]